MRQIAESFVHSWKRKRQYDGRWNYQAESLLKTQFANFAIRCEVPMVLKLWEPFAKAIPRNANEVADAFERMIGAEDAARKNDTFWALWQENASCLLKAPNLTEQLKTAALLNLVLSYWRIEFHGKREPGTGGHFMDTITN